uniref:Uncharacterized protein n=1 Tax=Anguilla anguilla TaxID=7936 RepID=A0A0E9PK15_ANGAN
MAVYELTSPKFKTWQIVIVNKLLFNDVAVFRRDYLLVNYTIVRLQDKFPAIC